MIHCISSTHKDPITSQTGGLELWFLTPLQQYFSYIEAGSFIGGGNQRKITDLLQVTDKLYHNVVWGTPHYERGSNSL
jgi:hypothetical protein